MPPRPISRADLSEPLHLEAVTEHALQLLENRLRDELQSLPGSLGYQWDGPLWLIVLQALLLPYDPRVNKAIHVRVRPLLRRKLPGCFQRSRRLPGRQRGRAAQMRQAIRRVYPKLVALYKNRKVRPGEVMQFIAGEGLAIDRVKLDKLQDIIETPMAAYEKARDTLAAALDAKRGTIDKVIGKRRCGIEVPATPPPRRHLHYCKYFS